MTQKGKVILAVSLSVVALGSVILAYGVWSIYSFLNKAGGLGDVNIPAELGEPRVLKGDDLLVKREIFKKVALSQWDMIIKDGFAYFDANGKVIWRYGTRKLDELRSSGNGEDDTWIIGVDFADLDDDGKLDFLISNKADGIRAFSADKRELWYQQDEYPTADFRLIDTDRDGTSDLVEFSGDNSKLRDKRTGKILRPLKFGGTADGIFEVVDQKKKGEVQIYGIADSSLIVTDLTGNVLYRSDAPLSEVKISVAGGFSEDDTESVYEPIAQMVRLRAGKPKYLVVLAPFTRVPRTNLYVYGPGGEFVYHELLNEDAETLSLLPNPDGTEGFLVGGKDTIWKYTAK